MKLTIAAAAVYLTLASPSLAAPPAPIVFFDIAGPATAHQTAFYEKTFGWKAGPGQIISAPVSGPVLHGTLRTDPAQKIIYIGVPDVRATLKDIEINGGKVVVPRFEVKGVAVIGLFNDPAGNAMGLVELGPDGRVKIP
jgi:predicted enzyme related to lactoylglutathione lyase